MSLVRFDPFRDLAILQDRVNRAFGDAARRNADDDLLAGGPWAPPVDIYENDGKAIVLKAGDPDVSREDISLKVENSTLTLSGKKQADNEVKERAVPPHRADVRQLHAGPSRCRPPSIPGGLPPSTRTAC